MYTVTEYDNPTDSVGKVIFNVATNKLVSAGKLTLKESDIDDFQLSVNQNNPLFGRVKPLQTHIVVKQDNTILFKGRALKPKREMTSSGQFVQSFSFESVLAYLLDSTQRFKEVHNTSPADFFKLLISVHNSQVPAYKQFKVGNVDVTNSTDNVYRFIDYVNTYDTIKDKLISRLGGFLRVRIESDGNYIDYLKDPGKEHSTDNQIKVGRNLKSASVEIDPTSVITRFIPLGATIESNNPNGETNVANPRITIASVNGGKDYIDIPELQAVFGVINGTNVWDDVHTPETLKPKADQWVRDQTAAEEHWTISAVEIGLDRFKTFNVSDSYQFMNPAVAEPQFLRITQKVIDLLNPHSSGLTIGDNKKTLTQYQSDALNAAKQVGQLTNKVNAQSAKLTETGKKLATATDELKIVKSDVATLKPQMQNKTLGALGDSITFAASIVKPYRMWAAERLHYLNSENYGISSTRIAKPDINGESMATRWEKLPVSLDAVVVMAGVNDYMMSGGVPMGTFDSRDNTTFYGACHEMVKGLSLRFVGKPLLLVPPLMAARQSIVNQYGFVLEDYANALAEVCQYYSVPTLDLRHTTGVNPNIDQAIVDGWTRGGDGLHPNEKYHELIGKRIGNAMLELI